ncbi:hypothetical protein GCM10007939_15720 [Amylibacter marinus]|uniref:Caspase family p20 domain-containing protein n=1 Tax=Amylibacter marinus TaxID=1475483 RepID=A0ABQ5VVG3_9RHOB|nr:caspase family protein [Amylibacter marinus]GLQ35289.1 hypothetical protein GCM10007939_15720 [Amylibacter marinus]
MDAPNPLIWLRALFLTLTLAVSTTAGLAQEARLALVIGNAQYQSLPQLKNPQYDAETISETLASLGFTVLLATNVNQKELKTALRAFELRSQKSDVTAVYFSGHGAAINGQNVLFGVDFNPAEIASDNTLTSVKDIQAAQSTNSKINMIFFDACREPITIESANRSIRFDPLAPRIPPIGTIISFASTTGAAAFDGTGGHSLFTGALLDNLRTENTDIEVVLRAVRRDVIVNSDGTQIPQTASGLVSNFYINPTEDAYLNDAINTGAIQSSLQQSGFRRKPILSEISHGFQAPVDVPKSQKIRAELIAEICERLADPLPAACLKDGQP